MNCKVMGSIHAFMHHELIGLYDRAFTWFENHRTDGEFRRSAPLHNFDIRLLFETQGSIAGVGYFDGN